MNFIRKKMIGSWIEKKKYEWEKCERRRLAGCEGCVYDKIIFRCKTPEELESLREETLKGIDNETRKKIAEEKEKIVKEKIKKILKKVPEKRSWVERRYLELWLPRR